MPKQIIQFNKDKFVQLLIGTAGIYLTYFAIGILQQWLIKYPYLNGTTGKQQKFEYPVNFLFFPHMVSFIMGLIYCKIKIPQRQATKIPAKNSILCALVILLGGITFNYAIIWTSYPIVITAKSCNLLSVILVGALCSRVTDKQLKLPPKKIMVGIFVSVGIILFKWFDPQAKQGQQKNFQFIGFFVLFVSLLADGFLPDFQAEIKSKFKPQPIEMMTQINKWVTIICGSYMILTQQAFLAVSFSLQHQLFRYHLIGLSLLTGIGHFIIYRMIKIFHQHIVPFVITTRKVFTVCISLIFYKHQTNLGQFFGILIVLCVVIYEFFSQIHAESKRQTQILENKQMIKISQDQINQTIEQIENNRQTQKI